MALNHTVGNNGNIPSVAIRGDLVVEGNLTVNGSSKLNELEITNLINENRLLKERVQELEEKMNQVWYAPGMPGYEISKISFFETCTK